MVVTAWAFTVHAKVVPRYVGECILMRGDNMSAIQWVNCCLGGTGTTGSVRLVFSAMKVSCRFGLSD